MDDSELSDKDKAFQEVLDNIEFTKLLIKIVLWVSIALLIYTIFISFTKILF